MTLIYAIKKTIKAILPSSLIIYIRNFKRKRLLKRRYIKRKTLRLSIPIVDHCNLNCIGCNVFSCIADEKYHGVKNLENDFKRIHELADGRIEIIKLLGGEPLLHPELLEILEIAGKYFYKTELQLVTNGILLEKQPEKFWTNCRRNNVKVIITKYPIKLPFDNIEEIGKKHGVTVGYYGGKHAKETIKKMCKTPLNLAGNSESQKSFRSCILANFCLILDEGKVYNCAYMPYIKYFNKQFSTDLQICDKDFIDIYKINVLDEIFEYWNKPKPFCRYCSTEKKVFEIDWAVSKKEISEWT